MAQHRIRRGLDLPITGEPEQVIHDASPVSRVAVLADDFPGLKARMLVEPGDFVRRGQPLFEDRKRAGVVHTAPGAGEVVAVNRGHRRVLRSVVIALSEGEIAGSPSPDELRNFSSYRQGDPASLNRDGIKALMVESGLWTAFRTRPFGVVAEPATSPAAIFVTAIDSHPLAPRPEVALADSLADFDLGLRLVSRLTDGTTYLCTARGSSLSGAVTAPVSVEEFSGPHPAGTPGVHIHILAPVSRNRTVWHIGYQDVAALGSLARSGVLPVERIVSLAGPPVERPRLLRTRLGASLSEIVAGERLAGDLRVISGSVLSGKAVIAEEFAYLGRYDRQISVLQEERDRDFLGWLGPGSRLFSVLPVFVSKLFPGRKFALGTSTHGAPRAIVPIGLYEKVMPFDIQPTYLLRALMVGDIERAEQLGCLELEEEDLSLCTFVDPGKTDFGPVLRKNLELIMKEG